MNDILYNLLLAVVTAAVSAIARYVVPYIRSKLAASKYAWAVDIIDSVVMCVEQTAKENTTGEAKKRTATQVIKIYLNERGIKMTEGQISTLIEAAVGAMNVNKPKEVSADVEAENY